MKMTRFSVTCYFKIGRVIATGTFVDSFRENLHYSTQNMIHAQPEQKPGFHKKNLFSSLDIHPESHIGEIAGYFLILPLSVTLVRLREA